MLVVISKQHVPKDTHVVERLQNMMLIDVPKHSIKTCKLVVLKGKQKTKQRSNILGLYAKDY